MNFTIFFFLLNFTIPFKLELIGITFLVFSIDKLIIIIILEGKNYEEFDGKLNIRRRKFM